MNTNEQKGVYFPVSHWPSTEPVQDTSFPVDEAKIIFKDCKFYNDQPPPGVHEEIKKLPNKLTEYLSKLAIYMKNVALLKIE